MEFTAGGSDFAFELMIPNNLPTTWPGDADGAPVTWDLFASSPAAGVDYSATFRVPVFNANGRAKAWSDDLDPVDIPDPIFSRTRPGSGSSATYPEPANHPGIFFNRRANGGCIVHFTARREWDFPAAMATIAAGMLPMLFFNAHFKGAGGAATIFAPIILLCGSAAIYTSLRWSTISADASGLRMERGWLFFRRRTVLSADQIENIVVKPYARGMKTASYQLDALTDSGRVMIAFAIKGKPATAWLSTQLLTSLRKSGVSPRFQVDD